MKKKKKEEKVEKDFRPEKDWVVEKCMELGSYYDGDWVPIGVACNTGRSVFVLGQMHLPMTHFSHKLDWKFLPQSDVHPNDCTLYSGVYVKNWRNGNSSDAQVVIIYQDFISEEFTLKKGEVLHIIRTKDGRIKLLIEYVELPLWFFEPMMSGKF